jgi:hypothetical protein
VRRTRGPFESHGKSADFDQCDEDLEEALVRRAGRACRRVGVLVRLWRRRSRGVTRGAAATKLLGATTMKEAVNRSLEEVVLGDRRRRHAIDSHP